MEALRHVDRGIIAGQTCCAYFCLFPDRREQAKHLAVMLDAFAELPLHQHRHQMHKRDRHAALLQSPRRFEPEQAATDHHCPAMISRGLDHCLDIGDIAEGAHIGKVKARNWGRQRHRQKQFVLRNSGSIGERHSPRNRVNRSGVVAGDQVNAVLLLPAGRLNDDFGKRPLARQHRGQKYAVVARVRLARR